MVATAFPLRPKPTFYNYSEREFGEYRAKAYFSGLERSFDLLADFPQIGRTIDELVTGHRRFRFQTHYVFYTIDAEDIVIRAIFYTARDIKPGLFS